jgi:G3E family GTPase
MTAPATDTPQKRIPVSVLTGFLGAGKTTLLNYILSQQHGYKFAVIVNEIGKIGIDGALVENAKDEVIEMKNGCVCCSIRKDLIESVVALIKRGGFDYILIETTGIADPEPVAQTFLNVPRIQQFAMLDAIITVVDCEQIEKQMRAQETARVQIEMADYILLNKTDLVTPVALETLEKKVRKLNKHATIVRTSQSQVNLKELLDIHAFDLDRKLEADPEFLNEMRARHHHDIISHSFEFTKPFVVERLQFLIDDLAEREQIYRSKGFLHVAGNPRRAVFHGVNNRFTLFWDRVWEEGEERKSQLVFIGKNLNAALIQQELERCLA